MSEDRVRGLQVAVHNMGRMDRGQRLSERSQGRTASGRLATPQKASPALRPISRLPTHRSQRAAVTRNTRIWAKVVTNALSRIAMQ